MPTPHLYTWPRFRGVFVGYIEILRYTSDLPPGGLGSSFLSGRPDFSLVFVLFLLFPLPSCILSYTLHVLYLVFVFHIYEDSSMIYLYIQLACIVL